MDLEEKLKSSKSPELFSSLEDIKNFCKEIWKVPLLPWFTNHNCKHSSEIVHLLGQLLKPLENHSQFLTDHELFILLASAYLHDIGMQSLKVDDISADNLTVKEYSLIRKRHAEESYSIILRGVKKLLERDDFHLPTIDEQYLPAIARVSKGHSTDYFEEVQSEFRIDPLTPKGRPMRGELLTALLMMADELDLQCNRIDLAELAKFKPSPISLVHWFKHHYVDFVGIEKASVTITLKFPPDSDNYQKLIKEFIEKKLVEQIEKVNPIFMDSTDGLLHLNPKIDIKQRIDSTNVKRPLPVEVLNELTKLLNKDAGISASAISTESMCQILPRLTPIFTGREEELMKFQEAFDKSSFISIEGLGGTGKTEFALKCIERLLPKEKVVWLDCVADSKLDTLIDCAGYPDVLKGESKTELAKYSGFTDLIERHERIIFLDNFQEVADPSFRSFFRFADKRLQKARIILIARELPDAGVRVAKVEVEGLKDDAVKYAKKLIDTYYSEVKATDNALTDICIHVVGHPLAIELAIQLLRYGESSEDIIKKIAETERSEELSKRLLDEVFKHPKSSDAEKRFMLFFSVFRGEVDINAISYVLGEDLADTLRKLIDKKMIVHYPETHLYGTHPLVREFCYKKLQDKKEAHLNVATYLTTQRKKKLEPVLEEEIFYHLFSGEHFKKASDLISKKGEEFVLMGHTNSLEGMINKAISKGIVRSEFYVCSGDIATIRGDWDQASHFFERAFLFDDCEERTMAGAFIKYGEMLFRKGEIKESLKYFEGAYATCRKNGYQREQARSLNDIGLVNEIFGDFVRAAKYLKEALVLREKIGDKSGLADTLNNLGNLFLDTNKFENALKEYGACMAIRKEIDDKPGAALCLSNMAAAYRRKGKLKEALETCDESLRIAKKIGDRPQIATVLNEIGMILSWGEESDEALAKYNESLKIRKEIGYRQGIASCLGNIAVIFQKKGNEDEAIKKYQESLIIYQEIGAKQQIAQGYHNLGTVFIQKSDYSSAMKHLLESFGLQKQMGITQTNTLDFISEIRRILGLEKFRELASDALSSLSVSLKPFVRMEDFFQGDTVRRETPKVGPNAPCSCKSGKKYKKCCGKP